MEWWQAIILGVVEGVTEYLPISSTGHLIITTSLLGLGGDDASRDAMNAFNIIIQGGAILAVLGLYAGRVREMLLGVVGRSRAGLRLVVNLIMAFLPAAVLGVLLNDWLEAKLFRAGPVIGALIVGGVYMLLVERWRRSCVSESAGGDEGAGEGLGIEDLTPAKAFLIGLMQCVAMWPGTSRSMMTITGGVFVGLRPAAAAEFSFLLGLPTLGGAMVYRLMKDILRARSEGTPTMIEQLGVAPTIIGVAVATISAAFAVKWLVGFLTRHGLGLFGWYRIVIGLVLVGLTVAGRIAWDG